ncbi:Gfo/Idh/MocA family protein [Frigoriglobus tundricola]|uniref:Gfo/Idh/MocA family oxidoreductase n=1 Tax=Frigoriglobus tundricola TaxID=2774151 RepID=A0A6M5YZ64_9BACT|nr:Gfo/Idh/MocA family oxidoreductase [Frigoriglobus tundricola]QJW98824.1 Gfo/Idh/MocA family oxidoreductase [Frigoriglobus tundricola]
MRTATVTRRRFLQVAGVSALTAASWARVRGANETLRLASVGTGGKGWDDLVHVSAGPNVNVVALCDTDEGEKFLGRAATQFKAAKTFTDWRRLLDRPKDFDAVTVSTPDHMHAPVALPAMALGKHVFCQKPLTHTVFEARQMRLAAKRAGVVTQMGNQIQSHSAYRTAVKLVRDGTIGKVKAVHSWQAGKMGWLFAPDRPEGADPVPAGLHWDEWLGAAPERPYKKDLYHSFNWRAWQDFSNGQLGDFGCHILDPVFLALGLTAPLTVRAESAPMNRSVWYTQSVVRYEFPGTERTAGATLGLTWYDGEGKLPPHDALGLAKGVKLPGAGSLLIGEKGSLLVPHVAAPKLFPEADFQDFKFETVPAVDHYVGWADACRGVGKTTSHFDYASALTETVLLGTVAIRTPGETLKWDAAKLAVTNSKAASALLTKPYRKGWEPTWV